jgi:ABC-type branched-subunit amino acid transport system substrate-binding protein
MAKRPLPPPLSQQERGGVKTPAQLIEQDFQRAERLYQQGQYTKALEQFQLFLLTYPSSSLTAKAQLRIGEIFYRQQQYAQSLEVLQRFQGPSPYSLQGEVDYLLALNYYHTGQHEASRKLLQQLFLATVDPSRQADIRYWLAHNYAKEGKLFLALEQVSQLLLTTEQEEYQQKGEELFAQIIEERFSRTTWEQVKQRYSFTPGFDRILLQLAEQAYQKRRYQRAQVYLQELITQFPEQAQTTRVLTLRQQLAAVQATLANKNKIGVLLPLTGEGSFAGQSAWQGIQLALSTAGTIPSDGELQLVTRDTAGDPQRVPALLEDLVIKERVIAVIGPLFSREAEQAVPVVEKLRIPLITPFAPDGDFPAASPYVFRNGLTNRLQAQTLARYSVQQLGLSRFAILFPEDAYGQDLRSLFRQFVTEFGGRIVLEASYSLDTTDFTDQIQKLGGISDEKLQQQGITELQHPYEAIFIPDYYDKIGLITKSLGFYNMHNVQLLGANGWNDPRLIAGGEEQLIEGAIFVDGFFLDSPSRQVQEFVRNFRSTFNRDPDILAAQAYDTAALLLSILQGGPETRDEVQKALATTRDFPGISGQLTFLPSGDADKTLFVLSVRGGRIIQIN